ncbi:hypothetical protein ACOMHN_060567 [Nucella lapillus]
MVTAPFGPTSKDQRLDYHAGGGSPWRFHVVNVALHALVTGLYSHLLGHVLHVHTSVTAAAALLFALHPVHVEADIESGTDVKDVERSNQGGHVNKKKRNSRKKKFSCNFSVNKKKRDARKKKFSCNFSVNKKKRDTRKKKFSCNFGVNEKKRDASKKKS